MAKRSRSSPLKGGRVAAANASRSLSPVLLPRPFLSSLSPVPQPLRELEDRRTFTFRRADRPAFSYPSRSAARVVVKASNPFRQSKAPLSFAVPAQVLICKRRKDRREVLFASGGSGRGKRVRRPRRTFWSRISCK